MSSVKTAQRLVPAALAAYIARSALRSRSSPDVGGGDADRWRAGAGACPRASRARRARRRAASTNASRSPTSQGEDRELVAAEAGDGVVGAQRVAQALAADLEQAVAGGVAERVVDLLEVVEVEEGDDGGLAARPASRRSAARTARGSAGRSASPRTRAGAARRRAGGGGRRGRAGPSSAVRPTTSSTITATVPIQDDPVAARRRARGCASAARAQPVRRTSNAESTSIVDRLGALEVARTHQRELLARSRAGSRRSALQRRAAPGCRAASASELAVHVGAACAVTSAWTPSGTRRRGGRLPLQRAQAVGARPRRRSALVAAAALVGVAVQRGDAERRRRRDERDDGGDQDGAPAPASPRGGRPEDAPLDRFMSPASPW